MVKTSRRRRKKMANETDFYDKIFKVPDRVREKSYVKSREEYDKLYAESIKDPNAFWAKLAEQRLSWFKMFDKSKVSDWSFAADDLHVKWFEGGKMNVSYNCLDRHLETKKTKAAIIFEGNDPNDWKIYTYFDMYREVNKCANVLKKLGVKKGDRVAIYLPMIPELAITMLACARIGAIHTVVFGGFSAEALRDRIQDSQASLLICADGYYRSGKTVASKAGADTAMAANPSIKNAVVVKRANCEVTMKEGRDLWWHDLMSAPDIKGECEPEVLDAEDPLFILYTSGSTGKPKGVVHTQGGYLLYAYQTAKWVFDLKDDDIHWCTADIGWITGHTY